MVCFRYITAKVHKSDVDDDDDDVDDNDNNNKV